VAGLEVLPLYQEGELVEFHVHVEEVGQEVQVRLLVAGVGRASSQPLRQRVQKDGCEEQGNAQPQQALCDEGALAAALQRVPGPQAGDQEQQRHRPDHPEPGDDGDDFRGLGVRDVEVALGREHQCRVEEDQSDHHQHAYRVQLRPPLRRSGR
jgi:hypothetical protein